MERVDWGRGGGGRRGGGGGGWDGIRVCTV